MQDIKQLLKTRDRKPEENLGLSIALGTLLQAIDAADDLEADDELPCPRKIFIEQRHDALMKELLENTYAMGKSFTEASFLLSEELKTLPTEEQNCYRQEWQKATHLLQALQATPSTVLENPEILAANTFQELMSISFNHLSWIYKVAHRYFDERADEKAYTLFSFLTFLNGTIFDFWLRIGIIQLRLQKAKEALPSFL